MCELGLNGIDYVLLVLNGGVDASDGEGLCFLARLSLHQVVLAHSGLGWGSGQDIGRLGASWGSGPAVQHFLGCRHTDLHPRAVSRAPLFL